MRRNIQLLGSSLLLLGACSSFQDDAVIQRERQSIIGGTPTNIAEFPTVVAVFNGGLCTGTLVTPTVVLTAAHCVDPALLGFQSQQQVTNNTVVVFDSTDLFNQQEGFAVQAAATFKNAGFNVNNLGDNDIGAVVLSQPINDRTPSPIDTDPGRNLLGTAVTMVGYGLTNPNNQNSAGQSFTLTNRIIEDCTQILGQNVNNKLLCFDQTDGRGKCSGDSGGPSFDANGVLVGITSFGDQNCQFFGADTRVSGELDFVNSVLGNGGNLDCSTDGVCQPGCGQNGNPIDQDCNGGGGGGALDCSSDDVCQLGCGQAGNPVDPDCAPGGENVAGACAVSTTDNTPSSSLVGLLTLVGLFFASLRRTRR